MPAEKVIQLSDYQSEPKGSSLSQKADIKNLAKSPGNMGFQGTPVTPLWENSEERSEGQEPETDVSHISGETKVSPTAKMTFGRLKAAYPREFQSWKNGKSRCKVKGWPWAGEWKSFKGFMLSKGPILQPGDYTLDRIDNAVEEYGPGLCRWASKTVQNNNKSDNLKLVVPLTGEVLTPKKVAKRHGVTHKTACKWFATYSPYELLIGKKSKALHAAWVAVDDHLLASGKTARDKKIVHAKKAPVPARRRQAEPVQVGGYEWTAKDHREKYGEEIITTYFSVEEWNEAFELPGPLGPAITPEEHERAIVHWWKHWKPYLYRDRLPTQALEWVAKIEASGYEPTSVAGTCKPRHPDPAEIVPWKPRDRTDADRAQMEQEDVLAKEWEEDFFRRQRARCSFFDPRIPGL
jgi:hypothetical protein